MSIDDQGTAILLVNLGSPAAPTRAAVARYLRQFLMDPLVIDKPFILRFLLVQLIIAPFRASASAAAYASIWQAEGSPLVYISQRQRDALQEKLSLPVALAMRYGEPSIASVIQELLKQQQGLKRICVLPLYPHYASSSTETVIQEVKDVCRKLGTTVSLDFLPAFYDDEDYIAALLAVSQDCLAQPYDHLLFSYHGLPARHLSNCDPTGHCKATGDCCASASSTVLQRCYRAQTYKTTQVFVQAADIGSEKYSIAFQSRLSKGWIQPFTDEQIIVLAQQGVKKLLVMCPSFVTDCLETLEEVQIRYRDSFIQAGGEDLRLIPCLNDHPSWINTLKKYCDSF